MSVPQVPPTDRNALSSLWGKLASEILMQNWEAAMEDLTRLRETIDNNVNASPFQNFPYTVINFDFFSVLQYCGILCLPHMLSLLKNLIFSSHIL